MTKKFFLLILVILLIAALPLSALADDAKPTDSTKPTDVSKPADDTPAVTLQIDDSNVYDGMDKSYHDGYTTTVSKGYATIVLPLVTSGAFTKNVITATPGLGDTSTSPFVFKNYQKTIGLQSNAVSGGGAVPSYLVRFDLELKKDRINGTYPVITSITATAAGESVEQSFTSYVTVSDGKNPEKATATPAPEHQPKILVSGYTINPDPVVAGGEFTATVTLENTNAKKAVYNTSVAVTCESQNFNLKNDTSTIYIGKIAKGGTADFELKYITDLNTPPQRYNISLAIECDNPDAQPLNSTGIIQVEVSQPLNVKMDKPSIPSTVNAGDTMHLAFQVMNMGRSKIYNARCELTAPGLIPTETAFIGNIEAGTAAQGKMDVFVGTKDMSEGYTGDDKYGPTGGKITLTYEDGDGKAFTSDTEIDTTINEPVIEPAAAQTEKQPDKQSQWWISLIIGGAVIAVIAAVLIYKSKRKRNVEI